MIVNILAFYPAVGVSNIYLDELYISLALCFLSDVALNFYYLDKSRILLDLHRTTVTTKIDRWRGIKYHQSLNPRLRVSVWPKWTKLLLGEVSQSMWSHQQVWCEDHWNNESHWMSPEFWERTALSCNSFLSVCKSLVIITLCFMMLFNS